MARPVQADAEATRKRVLEAACGLFAARGLAETTTRQIAREAGVSLATVHHYYGGKADLYEACIDNTYAELSSLTDELEAAFAERVAGSSMRGLFDLAIRRAYEFARRHRPSVQLLMRTILDKGEADPDLRERYQMPLLERGVRLLAATTNQPIARVRITFLALHNLIVHFALSTPREIAIVTGNPGASAEDCIRLVEDYLVSMALTQLEIPGDKP